MIPYQTDPSLHDHEPAPVALDDGFAPPQPEPPGTEPAEQAAHGTAPDAGGHDR